MLAITIILQDIQIFQSNIILNYMTKSHYNVNKLYCITDSHKNNKNVKPTKFVWFSLKYVYLIVYI